MKVILTKDVKGTATTTEFANEIIMQKLQTIQI